MPNTRVINSFSNVFYFTLYRYLHNSDILLFKFREKTGRIESKIINNLEFKGSRNYIKMFVLLAWSVYGYILADFYCLQRNIRCRHIG